MNHTAGLVRDYAGQPGHEGTEKIERKVPTKNSRADEEKK